MKTRQEFMEWLEEAEKNIVKYGWQNKKIYPYSYPIPVYKLINDCKDYDNCTSGSKEYLMALANGFKEILEAWIENESKPKVTVRVIKTGKIMRINVTDLDIFEGLVEIV